MAEVPVFHVNGDDPEAVVHVCRLAAEWRQKFHSDVVIDLICFRKFGHNEGDEPRFTQPLMYKQIDKQPSALSQYTNQLLEQGVITKDQIANIVDRVQSTLNTAHEAALKHKPKFSDWLDSKWEGFRGPQQLSRIRDTGVPMDTLQKVGQALITLPEGFVMHRNLEKTMFTKRKAAIQSGEHVDWGTAELLAFGSLLLEGNHVRVSGQDVERGTFSHRHAIFVDQNSGKKYCNLNNIIPDQKEKIVVTNSPLSEFGVLGFELGYSLENPNQLVCWEAQFGDFANGAQVIIDQFIAAGEAKWRRQSGLVMLLPHGYDGAGPEHSSARLERFLQLSASDPDHVPKESAPERVIQQSNLQVVNITTPANYFHALRRQVHRDFRKPLVVMSPKSLLKHSLAVSSLKDMSDSIDQDRFHRLIPETSTTLAKDKDIKKLVLCSGKVYYDLLTEREKRGIKDTAIVRIEQLYPFPFDRVAEQGRKYPGAKVYWVQEEHKNMGAWNWIAPHIRTAMNDSRGAGFFPQYIGRPAAASPATGSHSEHTAQFNAIMTNTFA
jgi:2-oxoglutarate dehydrogenase E1 component